MSLLALLKFKKNYAIFKLNFNNTSLEDKFMLKRKQLIIGVIYLVLGFGILLDFLTYFLLIILDPIPDRFAFDLLNYIGAFNPWALNGVIDTSSFGSPIETTVFYAFNLVSLICFTDI
ncbi:MAG: hypothetical protein KGD67_09310, partial [Candidatus Lokiarchaeota archaeon]|nr:hypothetical protein [Candidatus Lokiarchaeota archaeon]